MRNFILREDYVTKSGHLVPKNSIVTIAPMSTYNDLDSMCIEERVPYINAKIMLCESLEIIYSTPEGFSDDFKNVIHIDHINFTELPEYLYTNHIEVAHE